MRERFCGLPGQGSAAGGEWSLRWRFGLQDLLAALHLSPALWKMAGGLCNSVDFFYGLPAESFLPC